MSSELLGFWVIILFSLIGVVLSSRLKIPSAIGVLLAGAIIGPYGLGLIKGEGIISLLSELGSVFLLFFIGIHFSLGKISKYAMRATLVFILKFSFMFIFIYLASIYLNMSVYSAILLGILLSFSSTAIFSRMISDELIRNREESKLMSAVLILEDIFAVFIIAIFSQMKNSVVISINSILFSTAISLLVIAFSYVVLRWVVGKLTLILDQEDVESHLFFSLSLCALLTLVAIYFNLSPSVGAFLAGSILSTNQMFRKIETGFNHLILLFSAFFFFSVGMLIDIDFIKYSLVLVAVFTVLTFFLKFISVSFPAYLLGFESRSSVFSGLLMLTVSEFSLLIAVQANQLTDFDLVSFSAALLFSSAILTSVVYRREASIHAFISGSLLRNMKGPLKPFSIYMNTLITQFEPGGVVYQTFLENLRLLISNIGLLVILNSAIFLAGQNAFLSDLLGQYGMPKDAFAVLSILASIYPIINILKIIRIFIDKFAQAFHRIDKSGANIRLRVVADFMLFVFFLSCSVAIPFIFTAIMLPKSFHIISFVPFLVGLIFILDLINLSGDIIKNTRIKLRR